MLKREVLFLSSLLKSYSPDQAALLHVDVLPDDGSALRNLINQGLDFTLLIQLAHVLRQI